ncbi:dihydroxy-acid dehydratase [Actinobacteria bacterium YIM 96077]|uniref:Dihydroxy-acid dehydratase n=1 Tax=Phytoactinopolyspora halophila TaxID=1981511 RepID=A0A329QXM7_9ACTN|nr:IlvD/Edd family dehydratase [Phytoactinopolyspora halophila]AYY12737.1 dihydroxy-acid dehydratase [Actinobacteria bacterium YIM 96077]RAW16469.1 dihydroxy-acid dehydratase [Phytoactinopolyspora halophila]
MEAGEYDAPEASRRRSEFWFSAEGRNGFIHRSWMRNQGFGPEVFDGRPVVGIANSWSELTPCNAHLRDIADAVKRGVWEAGGFPLEFPTMSLGEPLMRPTTMLYRNLMAMEVEESIRANPVDSVVLLSGCDKTTPAHLMGAASVDVPAISVTGGPMLNGKFRGRDIGSGTDVWRFTEEARSGRMSSADLAEAEGCMSRSRGHCMTMGTASTMACVAEALGVQLAGGAAIPAVDSRRYALAQASGRRAVALAAEGTRPSALLTRQAFENAVRVNAALGGSTNAVVHLLALAGRVGVTLDLDDFDRLGADVPVLVDLMPSGRFLMEDFYYAGGLPAVMSELGELIHGDAPTVSGRTVGEEIADAPCWNRDVITTRDEPFRPPGSATAVLRGNLCPDGAVLKVSAASPHLLKHRGQALVFDRIEDYVAAADDLDLPVTPSTVIVVRNAGPRGYPGFPEVGNVPVPKVLLEAGVDDVVRISDARMSGTGYGTCVLHVAPEAAAGGPLALVRTGDWIELDTSARRLDVLVDDAELSKREAEHVSPVESPVRGWAKLYTEHVLQADRGADLDFLIGSSGDAVPRHSH